MYKRIIATSVLLAQTMTSFAQEGDGMYRKADCSVDIIKQSVDTIVAYGSPECTNHEIDTALDPSPYCRGALIGAFVDMNGIKYKQRISVSGSNAIISDSVPRSSIDRKQIVINTI